MSCRWPKSAVCAALLLSAAALPIRAQSSTGSQSAGSVTTVPADSAPIAPPARSRPGIFGRRDLLLLGGLVGATALIMPMDRSITTEFREAHVQNMGVLRSSSDFLDMLGQQGTLAISLGTLAVGKISGSETLTDVGLHASMAVVGTGLVTMGLKSVLGRQRPTRDANDSDVFGFGQGLGDDGRASLPSGHTSTSFALAAVMSEELARLKPGSEKWARPLFYGTAGLVGVSRIYDSRHWASDVFLGAGLGTLIGLKVSQLAHHDHATRDEPGNFFQRMSVSPSGGGVRIGWTYATRH
jgi:membrane-associated phospholipid phosphatase